MSSAGDVNGDGFDDICVGSNVVFGKAGGFSADFDLRLLDGTNGFRLSEKYASASGAGDVNGDGFEDLIVGAGEKNYVVFGEARGWSGKLNLAALDGTGGFAIPISSLVRGSRGGIYAVSGAGDVNGDGFADVLIEFPEDPARRLSRTATYVVFGHGGAFAPVFDPATLNGSNGFKIRSPYAENGSANGAGDVNGDGFADVIIGASEAAYVIFGHAAAFPRTLNAEKLDGSDGFAIAGAELGDATGFAVSGAGDVNGDGFADLLVGAPQAEPHGRLSGASYVIFGRDFQRFVFTDTDGDRVTVKARNGILDPSAFIFESTPEGQALAKIDVSRGGLTTGANLTITATPQTVNGRLQGDGQINIGRIDATGIDLGKVSIDGNLGAIDAGSDSATTPAIFSLTVASMKGVSAAGLESRIDGDLHRLKVVGDLSGITLAVTGDIGRIGKAAHGKFNFRAGIEVHGSINDARLATEGDLARLKIGGTLTNTRISARGDFDPIDTLAAQTIGRVTVEGSVDRTTILAGYDRLGRPSSADVQAGEIRVGGNWSASSLAIGVDAGSDAAFGTEDDALIGGGLRELVASVASIVIKGQAVGGNGGADHFGFVAEQIRAVKIARVSLGLTPGPDTLDIAPSLTLRDGVPENSPV